MKRKRHARGIEAIDYGQCPFFGNEESADAADAARYRYLTRPGRDRDFVIPANESKASCDAAIDGKRKEMK